MSEPVRQASASADNRPDNGQKLTPKTWGALHCHENWKENSEPAASISRHATVDLARRRSIVLGLARALHYSE